MTTRTTTVSELAIGEYCRTQSGRYLRAIAGGYKDELGNYTYPKNGYDEPVEILPGWPGLSENEFFELVTIRSVHELNRRLLPNDRLLFQTDQGFRIRVQMHDYRITIPFKFGSIDPRVPVATAEWTAKSGQIVRHLVGQRLRITYDEKPTLNIGYGRMTIPSQ